MESGPPRARGTRSETATTAASTNAPGRSRLKAVHHRPLRCAVRRLRRRRAGSLRAPSSTCSSGPGVRRGARTLSRSRWGSPCTSPESSCRRLRNFPRRLDGLAAPPSRGADHRAGGPLQYPFNKLGTAVRCNRSRARGRSRRTGHVPARRVSRREARRGGGSVVCGDRRLMAKRSVDTWSTSAASPALSARLISVVGLGMRAECGFYSPEVNWT